MSSKKPLVKQRSAYGSLGGGKLSESEEDLSLKESTRRRVYFEGEPLSSDDGSDLENSFGRNNRSHGKGNVLDGLFKDSSVGERQDSLKGTNIVIAKDGKRTSQGEKGQRQPVPRHRPLVSPRHSPTERHVVELDTLLQSVKVHDADESTMTSKVRDRHPVPVTRTAAQKQQGESATLERTSPKPTPRSRPKLSVHEGSATLLVSDSEAKHEWTRDTKEKLNAPLRRKHLTKEFDYESQTNKIPQVPRIKYTINADNDYDDDDDDDDDNSANAKFLYGDKRRINVGLAASTNNTSDGGDAGEIVTDRDKAPKSSFIRRHWSKEEELSKSRPEASEKSGPDSYLTSGLIDNGIMEHIEKRPRSVPATRLETLSAKQSSLENKKLVTEHGAHRVLPKKSLTPQRPQSAKKNSLVTKLSRKDITDTFEEHVASSENIIDCTGNKEQFERKVNHTLETDRVWDTPRHHFTQPIKASQGINQMTKSPQLEETVTNRGGRHLLHGKSPVPKRASSLTNLRGHSPEVWNQALDQNSLDTSSIRQAVYDEWLARKSSRMKEQLATKASDKKKQEQKEEEERQRKLLAKRAFDSWNEKKQEENKETSIKKKEILKKELETQKERNLKATDAKKYFESWKAKKDVQLKEQHQKKRKENQEKRKKEEDQKQENTANAKKAFENWKNKKDVIINEEMKKKKREENKNAMEQEDDKYERSIKCAERFQAWVEKKGKPRRGPSPPHLTQRGWCPSGRRSGNCIPDKVGSVIQIPSLDRSRSYSGTQLGPSKF